MNRIHVIWFLVSASDGIADLLLTYYWLRTKTRFGRVFAVCAVTLAIESILAAFSLVAFWQDEILFVPAFAITRTIGRSIKSAGMWLVVAYLFYWINGDLKPQAQGEATAKER